MTSISNPVFKSITSQVNHALKYLGGETKQEYERLFLLESDINSFVEGLSKSPSFRFDDIKLQYDRFFDLTADGNWLLSTVDSYVRIREELTDGRGFISAEIKSAFPGAFGNPNHRPADDQTLGHVEVERWYSLLKSLGFELERQFSKRRVGGTWKATGELLDVELEIDMFLNSKTNGRLANRSFVSLSCEVSADKFQQARKSHQAALQEIAEIGQQLVPLDGNYESFYYGHKILPTTSRGAR